jgi:sugar phosphate isomerase/epimerase
MSIKIGTIIGLWNGAAPHLFDRLVDLGLSTCQISNWDPTLYERDFDGLVASIKSQMESKGVTPSAIWGGYSGRVYWNFTEGPITLGLIPPEHRHHRIHELQRAADFAHALGLRAIITHVGFLPESPTDPLFHPVRVAVAAVAEYCKKLGVEFWFETGQETPVTLLRYIQALGDMGLDNIGINLDPANLLLYGKGNPVDALDVFGPYVKSVHAKDGFCPTDPYHLGREVRLGDGLTRYPVFVPKLLGLGFTGDFIIEREISGDEQKRDILHARDLLRGWMAERGSAGR